MAPYLESEDEISEVSDNILTPEQVAAYENGDRDEVTAPSQRTGRYSKSVSRESTPQPSVVELDSDNECFDQSPIIQVSERVPSEDFSSNGAVLPLSESLNVKGPSCRLHHDSGLDSDTANQGSSPPTALLIHTQDSTLDDSLTLSRVHCEIKNREAPPQEGLGPLPKTTLPYIPDSNDQDSSREEGEVEEEEEEVWVYDDDDEERSEESWSPSPIPEDPGGTKHVLVTQLPDIIETGVSHQFMKDLIRYFKCGHKLDRDSVMHILTDAKLLLMKQSSLVDIHLSKDDHVIVCGDIHGQFFDLANIFDVFGYPSTDNQYLFNGDFVDRGVWSVEVTLVLLGFKLLLPDNFFLARGNHEAEEVNRVYGFENEVLDKYDSKIFRMFQNVFDWLPVTHCVNQAVLIMHGGLPCSTMKRAKSSGSNGDQSGSEDTDDDDQIPSVTLEDIRGLRRGCPVPKQGLMCDLLWADPREEEGTAPNNRGYSSVFGPDITKKFLADNNLLYIVRSHECVQQGFTLSHNDTVITVFSAPNYCDRRKNKGAVCILHGDDISMPEFRRFKAVPHPKIDRRKYTSIYMKYGLC